MPRALRRSSHEHEAASTTCVLVALSLSDVSVHVERPQFGAVVTCRVRSPHQLGYFHLCAHENRSRGRERDREQSFKFRYPARVVRRKVEPVGGGKHAQSELRPVGRNRLDGLGYCYDGFDGDEVTHLWLWRRGRPRRRRIPLQQPGVLKHIEDRRGNGYG